MASHKRRVERKLKKEVKRKVQASRAKQQSNAQNKESQLEQMMKLVALMKGNGVNTDQATLLKLREEKAKADGELARTKRESAVSIEQSKAKTKGLTKEDAELQAQVVKLQTENKNMDEEIERIVKQSGIDKLKDVLEKAKQLNVKLKSKKSAVEGIGTYLKDKNLSLEPSIELLSDTIKNAEDNIFKLIEEGKTSVQIDEFYKGMNYENLKKELQDVNVGLALKYEELQSLINKKKMDQISAKDFEAKNEKLKNDIKLLEKQIDAYVYEIDHIDELGNITYTEEPVLDKEGKPKKDANGKIILQLVKRDISNELIDEIKRNRTLERAKRETETNLKMKEDAIEELNKLNFKNSMLDAENKALGEVVVEDKTAEMGRLNKEIADLNDAIRDKRQHGLDAKAYERKLAEKEREKKELEAENNAMGAAPVVRTPVINKYAQTKVDSDKTQRDIDVKNRDKKLIEDQEDENAKQDFENKKRTQLLRSSNPQINAYKSKAVTNWVMAQKQKELNEVKEENYKSEQELRNAQTEGNAHKLPEIQETEKKIQEQKTQRLINEEKTKAQQALNRERAAARTTLIQRKAEQDMNMAMANDTSITDMTSALTALNEKINRETENAQNDEKYVDSVLGNIKGLASEHAEMMEVVNQYLTNKGKAIFETPDAFSMRVHSRMQADALKNIVDALAETYNPEDQFYYFDNMPADADTWLNRLYEQQNDDDNDFLE